MMKFILLAILLSTCGVRAIRHDTFFDPYLRKIEEKVLLNTGKVINITHPVVFGDMIQHNIVGFCVMGNWLFEPYAVIDRSTFLNKSEDEKEAYLFYILTHESLGHCEEEISEHRLDIIAFKDTGVQIGKQRFGNKYKIIQYPAMPGSIMWPYQMNHQEVHKRADWYITEIYNPGYNQDVVARVSLTKQEDAMDLYYKFIYEVYDLNNNKLLTTINFDELAQFLTK